MNVHQQLANKIRVLAIFCLEKRGKCFAGMTPATLFKYVAFHLLNGSLFVQRDESGGVQMVVFVWREHSCDLLAREAAGLPQFFWQMPPAGGDAVLIGAVIGERRWMPQILQQVTAHIPESPRLFTYRHRDGKPKLSEITWPSLRRFTYGTT